MVWQKRDLYEWQKGARNEAFKPRRNRRGKTESHDIVEDVLCRVGDVCILRCRRPP